MSQGEGATSRRQLVGRWPRVGGLLLGGLVTAATAMAQGTPPPSGGPYRITKQVIAAGGERATGGIYALTGTVGQPATDTSAATGSGFRLSGGFHVPAGPVPDGMFQDGFED